MKLLTRAEWGARPPSRSYVTFPDTSYRGMEAHHTVYPASWDAVRHAKAIQDMHLDDKGWTDVFYAFGLHPDGTIVELRGWNRSQGSDVAWDGGVVMPVVFFGNYEVTDPTDAQIESWHTLRWELVAKNPTATTVRYHGMRSSTACPGHNIIRQFDRLKTPSTPPPPKDDEMTADQEKALHSQLEMLQKQVAGVAKAVAAATDDVLAVDKRVVALDGKVVKQAQKERSRWQKLFGQT